MLHFNFKFEDFCQLLSQRSLPPIPWYQERKVKSMHKSLNYSLHGEKTDILTILFINWIPSIKQNQYLLVKIVKANIPKQMLLVNNVLHRE